MTLEEIFNAYPEDDFLIADGFDDAVIDVEPESLRLIYDVDKCIDILMKDGMDYEDAREYFDFNVSGSYMGPKTPLWIESDGFYTEYELIEEEND